MRIAIVTDAWEPQINGVVSTLKATAQCLRSGGHEVNILSAENQPTFACPGCPDIRLACAPYARVAMTLDAWQPDCIHIATEGPMGLAARRYCIKRGLRFTTSYHTRFPEYLHARSRLPPALLYRWLRWFHSRASAVMVATPAMKILLEQRGFERLVIWGRGVDTERFQPEPQDFSGTRRPVYLYVGRVAVEKNVEDFLRIDMPGSKWVIGDGAMREELERRYPQVRFLGAKPHAELAAYYNCADVFVFPSRTDTFGLVMAEAMACGVPVAAYPVEGPIDVVAHGVSGILHQDLTRACFDALKLRRAGVRQYAMRFSWSAATAQFLAHLHPAHRAAPAGYAASQFI
ncbi:MAG TPA: glycosyltransferase family 1 protein [Noviherbaspirillum sp.]|jgi:glycosyltransferase involved in cell wall biosynthesis|uniref:glycosyltransferase family 4 protein n=1 Tax=Noviherbaspirillum sp. TaxID=1926288 RepID=UPI002DDDA040|nr:glycosyltransferase family 1 protein [Noviherbaspirillum sp.]HEV2611381.1 glycosyltransferase family 1 protein [Noviherbaspirillum sp.]